MTISEISISPAMKKTFLSILLAVIGLQLYAQQAQKLNPDAFRTETRFKIGLITPVTHSAESQSDVLVGLDHLRYFSQHLGYSLGVQYSPNYMNVNNYVGFPIAFVYHTRNRNIGNAVENGVFNMAGRFIWSRGRTSLEDEFETFLLSLFSRAEIYAGFTPGFLSNGNLRQYVDDGGFDVYDGVSPSGHFTTTLDLGLGWSYRISHIYITINPALHYGLWGNYQTYSGSTDMTLVRTHFTICASLGYAF